MLKELYVIIITLAIHLYYYKRLRQNLPPNQSADIINIRDIVRAYPGGSGSVVTETDNDDWKYNASEGHRQSR